MVKTFEIQKALPTYIQIFTHFEQQIKSGKLVNSSKLPTERELSEELKVSRETVSKALKLLTKRNLITQRVGKGTFVSYDPRQESTIRKIALCGNPFSRGLRSPDPYFSQLTGGIYQFFSENLLSGVFVKEIDNSFFENYNSYDLCGAIVYPTDKQMGLVKKIAEAGIPQVVVSKKHRAGINSINVNCYNGTVNGLEYLYGLGHRNIGALFRTEPKYSTSSDRLKAYNDFIKAKKLKYETQLKAVLPVKFKYEDVLAETKRIINTGEVTAIFCSTLRLTVYFCRALNELNIKIPEDVSVIGFDDFPIFTDSIVSLTTINQPVFDIGYKAAEALLRQIKNMTKTVKHITLDTNLVIRKSCKNIVT